MHNDLMQKDLANVKAELVARTAEVASLTLERDSLLADLRLIAQTDPIDAALDPQRAVRVAAAALARSGIGASRQLQADERAQQLKSLAGPRTA